MVYELDCGDNSCLFVMPEKRTGMRTNGGCRCLENLGLSRQQERPIRMWAINAPRSWRKNARLAALREVKKVCSTAAESEIAHYVQNASVTIGVIEEWIDALIKREEEGR